MSENRRVVVTGLGVVSPVGSTVETAWDNLIGGFNGIGPITCFDTTNYKAKLGAEVKGFDPMDYMDKRHCAVTSTPSTLWARLFRLWRKAV